MEEIYVVGVGMTPFGRLLDKDIKTMTKEAVSAALADAGIQRIRPVMITVGATILALFPLALEGGPLWQPLCYAQIGGLGVATFITLLLVPVLYSIFVLDLKIIRWEANESAINGELPEAAAKAVPQTI